MKVRHDPILELNSAHARLVDSALEIDAGQKLAARVLKGHGDDCCCELCALALRALGVRDPHGLQANSHE